MFSFSDEEQKFAYVSNCNEGEVADVILVIGRDNPGQTDCAENYKKLKALCEQKKLKYAILGNGVDNVNLEDIERLPMANNLIIGAHGKIKDGMHVISLVKGRVELTLEILARIHRTTGCENTAICSCYCGKIFDDISQSGKYELEEGSHLSTFSSADEWSLIADGTDIQTAFVDRIKPGEKINMPGFVIDMLKTIPETATYGYQSDGELASKSLHRNDRITQREAERFSAFRISNFYDFLYRSSENNPEMKHFFVKEFPMLEQHASLKTLNEKLVFLESQITPEEIARFQKHSLRNHLLHGDIEIVDKLTSTAPFDPELLYFAIQSSLDMLKVILKNLKNATHGQTLNAFVNSDEYQTDRKFPEWTPLTLVLNDKREEKNIPIVRLLLEHGADIHVPDKNGRKPAEMMDEIVLQDASLPDVNFSEANLRRSVLNRANLSGAQLMNADLSEADLIRTNLANSDLSNANLMNAELKGANLSGANLVNTKGLSAQQLLSAGALMNVRMAKDEWNRFPDRMKARLEDKMIDESINYLEESRNASEYKERLTLLTSNHDNPLRFSDAFVEVLAAGQKILAEKQNKNPHAFFSHETAQQSTTSMQEDKSFSPRNK